MVMPLTVMIEKADAFWLSTSRSQIAMVCVSPNPEGSGPWNAELLLKWQPDISQIGVLS